MSFVIVRIISAGCSAVDVIDTFSGRLSLFEPEDWIYSTFSA